jgi:transitional endoplasmic reticulum ATPase
MNKSKGSIAYKIGVRQATIDHFSFDFGIDVKDYQSFNTESQKFELEQDFIDWLIYNQDLLRAYEEDYYSEKTIESISKKIDKEVILVKKYLIDYFPNNFKEGALISNLKYISSFKIDFYLGNGFVEVFEHDFLKNKIANKKSEKRTPPNKDIIGYNDVYNNILSQLEPITNPTILYDWGLDESGGILLFGPPGCGKTFWAEKVTQELGYEFMAIPRSLFGSSYVDGAMNNLIKILNGALQKERVVIFFDEFDSIASMRNIGNASSTENAKVVNTLLQEIPNLIKRKVILMAATNFLRVLDPAVIRPGRFDLKIPIFPPNLQERCNLIHRYMFKNIEQDSILYKILIKSNVKVDDSSFWLQISSKMHLFSNSMVIGFVSILKKKLKHIYDENLSRKIIIDEDLLIRSLNEAAQLTKNEFDSYVQFHSEVSELGANVFEERLNDLKLDIEECRKRFSKKNSRNKIGY